MAKKEEQPLAKVASTALVAAPDFIPTERTGFDTVEASDVLYERLALMQSLTPAVKQKLYQEGDIVRRSTEDVLYTDGGVAPLITPVYYFKEFVEFGDRDNQNEPIVIARSTDRTSKLAEEARQWVKKKVTKGEVRKVQDQHNFIVIVNGLIHEPLLVTLGRSSQKAGSQLLALTNGRGNKPLFAGVYNMFSKDETNRRNQTYRIFAFKNHTTEPWVTKEVFEACQQLNKNLAELHKADKLKGDYTDEDRIDEGEGPVVNTDPNTAEV